MSQDEEPTAKTPFSPEQLAWLDRLIDARQASLRPPVPTDPGQSSTPGATPSTSAGVNSDSGTATTSAGIQGLITVASLPGKYRMWDKVSGCWVSRSPAAAATCGVSVAPVTATGRGVAVARRHKRHPSSPPSSFIFPTRFVAQGTVSSPRSRASRTAAAAAAATLPARR